MAGIIKAAGRQEPAAPGVFRPFQFDDVGDSYLKRVRGEAARIIAEAQKQAAQIKGKAQAEGKQAAIEAAEAAMRAQLDRQIKDVLAALESAAEQIAHSRHAWQQHWEQHAIELATAIARRICRQELSQRPEITREWVREALELSAGSGAILVRLHPEDHRSLKDQIEQVASRLTGIGGVQIIADPAITSGGCRVETEFGSLDQQLETQLARLTEELLD
jgi:flagellar assembly protein FliH